MIEHRYHQDFAAGLFSKYAQVRAYLPDGGAILEIGCHTGYFSRYLQAQGYTVLGVEYDHNAAEVAAAAGVNVICGDVEDAAVLAVIDRQFDRILLMDVLEHLRDPAQVIRRLGALLRPGGAMIITGPNIMYWAVRKDLLLGRWRYGDTGILDRTHLHLYSSSDWRDMIAEAGYSVRNFTVAEGFLPLEHLMRRVPILRTLLEPLRRIAFRKAPDLFATVFLIEIVAPGDHSAGKTP